MTEYIDRDALDRCIADMAKQGRIVVGKDADGKPYARALDGDAAAVLEAWLRRLRFRRRS